MIICVCKFVVLPDIIRGDRRMKVILPFEIGDTVIVKEEVDGSIEFNEYIYDGISRRGHRFGYADESDECLYFDLCDVVKKYE